MLLLRSLAMIAVVLIPAAVSAGGAWDGTWTLRPASGSPSGTLVIIVDGDSLSWWIPDDATMRSGEEIQQTDLTLAFRVGAAFGGARIFLSKTGLDSAEGQSKRPGDRDGVPLFAMRGVPLDLWVVPSDAGDAPVDKHLR
jgi:hypothetical protein